MLRKINRILTGMLTLSLFAALVALAWLALAYKGELFAPDPPATWRIAAQPRDILFVEGREVTYWGRPDAQYSKYATRARRKPVAVVVHHNLPKPPTSLVRYGHQTDPDRGNASYGYHFYIGRDGAILQGAPLSRRTNHVKFVTNKKRRGIARHVWSGNAIGVSLVGACNPWRAPQPGNWMQCAREAPTPEQLEAGLAVIRTLQERFGMGCKEVYGHGELQVDRQSFEGETLSRLARAGCGAAEPPVPAPGTADATASAGTDTKAAAAPAPSGS